MKKFRNTVLAAALAAFVLWSFTGGSMISLNANAQTPAAKASYAPIPGGTYMIDAAHSTIGFSIRHYEINWVAGRFKDFTGSIRYDEADVTKSSVEFTAKIVSIDTGVAKRDEHLRTADFFDAAKHPELSFKSTRIESKGKDNHILHGDFTLKGVTKPVAIPFKITGAIKDPRGNTRFGIDAQTKLDRREYGITWGKPLAGGGLDVGNEVMISLQLEAMLPAPKPAPAPATQ